MKRITIYYMLRLILSVIFGVGVGVGILWADAYAVEVFDVLLIALGVLNILFNLPNVAISVRAIVKKTKWEWINLILSLISMGFGVSFLLISRTSPVLPYILLGYVTVLPLARIILVSARMKQIRMELPKIFIGAFLLVVTTTQSENTMFYVLGIAVIAISVLYLLKGLLEMPFKCRPYEERFDK